MNSAHEPTSPPTEGEKRRRFRDAMIGRVVSQIFPPASAHDEAIFEQVTPHFVLTFEPVQQPMAPWKSVPWLKL